VPIRGESIHAPKRRDDERAREIVACEPRSRPHSNAGASRSATRQMGPEDCVAPKRWQVNKLRVGLDFNR